MSKTQPPRRLAHYLALGAFALAASLPSALALAQESVSVTVLHQFTGITSSDGVAPGTGAFPVAAPFYYTADQRLYGSARGRGHNISGSIVWSLNPALSAGENDFRTVNAGAQMATGFIGDNQGNFVIGGTNRVARTFHADLLAAEPSGSITEITGASNVPGLYTAAADGTFYLGGYRAVGAYPNDWYHLEIYCYLDGTLTTLVSAASDLIAGSSDAITLGDDGLLYGIVAQVRNGGVYGAYDYSDPFIYRLDPSAENPTLEKLADFSETTGYPDFNVVTPSSLIDGGDGWLYGTTHNSTKVGDWDAKDLLGKVYRINKTADGEGNHAIEALHSFTTDNNGGVGAAGQLVLANDSNIYGTTLYGGEHDNGTIFRIVFNGDERTFEQLYSFPSELLEGARPNGLVQGEDWVLYGTARSGGLVDATATNGGTVFKVTLSKPAIALESFTATPASLVLGDGQAITLAWSVKNVLSEEACSISAGDAADYSNLAEQKLNGEGSLELAIPATPGVVTFTLSCDDNDGTVKTFNAEGEQVTVSVLAVAHISSFTASPTTLTEGDSLTLSWAVTNATACTASASPALTGWSGEVNAQSGSKILTPTSAGSYTLTLACTAEGGDDSESRTVTINGRRSSGGAFSPLMILPLGLLAFAGLRRRKSVR